MINWQNGTTPINETNMNKIVQEDIIADEYSSSRPYYAGEYCIYGNTLYRCIQNSQGFEEWTPAHWTATTIATELNSRLEFEVVETW